MNIKKWIKKGYVSVEAVIVGGIILAAGFAALTSLSVNGTAVVQNSLGKLDALGVFNVTENVPEPDPEPEVEPYLFGMTNQIYGLERSQFVYTETGEQAWVPEYIDAAAVRVEITNNSGATIQVKTAKILHNGTQLGYVMPASITYMGAQNLLMKEIFSGTVGTAYLFFEMDQGGINFTTTPKSELQLVLTLMTDEVITLNNFIGN